MSEQRRKVRRKPKFGAFLFTGGLAGLLTGFLVSVVGRTDTRYDATAALGFLGLICAAAGILVGGVLAVLLDRRP